MTTNVFVGNYLSSNTNIKIQTNSTKVNKNVNKTEMSSI